MSRTTTIFAGVLVIALAASGVAIAADRGDDAAPAAATGTATTYTVADAGSVTLSVEGSSLVVERIQAATGWRAVIDSQTATELEVDFSTAAHRLRFNAELEDGVIRTRLEDRTQATVGDDDSTTTTSTPASSSTTAAGASTGSAVAVTTDDHGADHQDDDLADDLADDHGGDHQDDDRRGDDDLADDHGGDRQDDDAVVGTTLTGDLGLRTVAVPGVGTITVDVRGDSVGFVSAAPAPGWSASLDDASDGEVEVEFTDGRVEVDAKLEIEHGSLRLEIEQDD